MKWLLYFTFQCGLEDLGLLGESRVLITLSVITCMGCVSWVTVTVRTAFSMTKATVVSHSIRKVIFSFLSVFVKPFIGLEQNLSVKSSPRRFVFFFTQLNPQQVRPVHSSLVSVECLYLKK